MECCFRQSLGMMGQKKYKKTLYWGDKVWFPIPNCRKIQYNSHTEYSKFGMANYTNEIVITR